MAGRGLTGREGGAASRRGVGRPGRSLDAAGGSWGTDVLLLEGVGMRRVSMLWVCLAAGLLAALPGAAAGACVRHDGERAGTH